MVSFINKELKEEIKVGMNYQELKEWAQKLKPDEVSSFSTNQDKDDFSKVVTTDEYSHSGKGLMNYWPGLRLVKKIVN